MVNIFKNSNQLLSLIRHTPGAPSTLFLDFPRTTQIFSAYLDTTQFLIFGPKIAYSEDLVYTFIPVYLHLLGKHKVHSKSGCFCKWWNEKDYLLVSKIGSKCSFQTLFPDSSFEYLKSVNKNQLKGPCYEIKIHMYMPIYTRWRFMNTVNPRIACIFVQKIYRAIQNRAIWICTRICVKTRAIARYCVILLVTLNTLGPKS